MRKKSWDDDQLRHCVANSKSLRGVIQKLGLIPAGGNYFQVQERIKELKLDNSHFTGYAWNKGLTKRYLPRTPLEDILVRNSKFQSFKLKKRLFIEKLKESKCELCGWCEKSKDGRVPLELDHINGDHFDNRIENLRILCPNCHSLQPTHRGRNSRRFKKNNARVV